MASFNDPQKLADAIALARGFKTGKFDDAIALTHEFKTGNFYDENKRGGMKGIRNTAAKQYQDEANGFVPPSKRQYSRDALEKGWRIEHIKAGDAVVGQAVFDFLSRVNPAPAPTPNATPVATPELTASVPTTSQTAGNFTTPRSPIIADASGPMTPESLFQESDAGCVSPRESRTEGRDEQAADELAGLLETFSFKDAKPTDNAPGHIMERFWQLLAKNVKMSQRLDTEKKPGAQQRANETKTNETKNLKGDSNSDHRTQPNKGDQCPSVTTNAVPHSTPEGKDLRPQAPAFVPSPPGLPGGGIESSPSTHGATTGSEITQEQMPFTGQFSKSSDDTPQGYWPAIKKPAPAVPLTYTVWVPVQCPIPEPCIPPATTTQMAKDEIRGLGSPKLQPMKGLSVSRWANQPPNTTA